MKKKSIMKFLVVMTCGCAFQLFGGCNFDRILGGIVDHVVFEFVEPFIGQATGALTGDTE